LYIPLSGVLSCNGYDPAACLIDSTGSPIQAIEFTAGSVCIIPPSPSGGDINLNGIANEIGDAVLFSNYFIYGTAVFDPVWMATQVAATETNCDLQTMSTIDLSYLTNVIIGDLQPCNLADSAKLSRGSYAASSAGPTPSDLDTMRIVNASAAPGQTFTVDLYLRNIDTLGVLNFRLRYDPAQIVPITDTLVQSGDTTLTAMVQQPGGAPFDVFAAGLPSPGVLTFLANDFDMSVGSEFLPGGGAAVRMSWMVLPSATDPFAIIAFEDDPEFPQSFNTMVDIHAAIWKRPVMVNGSVNIGGAVCDCPHQGDMDLDGFITAIDLGLCIDALFAGGVPPHDPECPSNRLDLDCSGYGNAIDLAILIDHMFAGQPGPCNPCSQ
jgi:hypothetical protein